jgi:hypothetical protein
MLDLQLPCQHLRRPSVSICTFVPVSKYVCTSKARESTCAALPEPFKALLRLSWGSLEALLRLS